MIFLEKRKSQENARYSCKYYTDSWKTYRHASETTKSDPPRARAPQTVDSTEGAEKPDTLLLEPSTMRHSTDDRKTMMPKAFFFFNDKRDFDRPSCPLAPCPLPIIKNSKISSRSLTQKIKNESSSRAR